MKKLKIIYSKIENDIVNKVNTEFRRLSNMSNKRLFAELSFCLLTPQSNAKVCWRAIEILMKNNLLYEGTVEEIKHFLTGVRFHNNKANYIVLAREKLIPNSRLKRLIRELPPLELREYLVKNIKGLGWKEASHFLRNIGRGKDVAILDRHILRKMRDLNIINQIPDRISKKSYLEMEEKLKAFSGKIKISMDQLDLLLWYSAKGEIFK
jgi:N-glycosylase/DNA lyase